MEDLKNGRDNKDDKVRGHLFFFNFEWCPNEIAVSLDQDLVATALHCKWKEFRFKMLTEKSPRT